MARRALLAAALGGAGLLALPGRLRPAAGQGLRPAAGQGVGQGAGQEAGADPLDPTACLDDFQSYREAATDLLPEVEEAVRRATADRRDAAGVAPLVPDERLRWIARFYAAHITRAGLSHTDPQGRGPGQRIGLLHRRLVGPAGENLFQSSRLPPSGREAAGSVAVDSLMESPGHRRNILERRWTHAGMGAVADGDGFVVVQLFAQRAALLAGPMPAVLEAGRPLPPVARQFAEGMPDRVGFGPPTDGPVAVDTVPLADARTPAAPGIYRSLYAFLRERTASGAHYEIAPGPIVRVG
ncbi:CAP domain-containing protein [Rhodocista pekingensis]|uniref:CAP domain-containing protein n=1 Tax=Rhodocista pekingensis TaxID=201185 RepID=A0ABW2L0A3_9PROT